MGKKEKKKALRRWRKRGFYSEKALVERLRNNGYNAVRVPVSSPSRSPLPDVMARRNQDVYAFEVKNSEYYAYYPRSQIIKLFRFLDELIPIPKKYKHAVLAAHFGRKWLFKEIEWERWENDELPEKERIMKGDEGNFKIDKR
jgi:Holliday junction resolvase